MSDFSTKVLEQAETIESVLDDTRRSTVHLDRGQQELRVRAACRLCFSVACCVRVLNNCFFFAARSSQSATEHSSTFRILVMIVMLVLGVAMLFIDWFQ